MNAIEKQTDGLQERMTFGGIEMVKQATVALSSMNPAPYTVNEVTRNTVFVFNAGEEIYELIDPDGGRWVMQTWSQVADPDLSSADLAGRSPCRRDGATSRACSPRRCGSTPRRDPHASRRSDQQLLVRIRLSQTTTGCGPPLQVLAQV